MSRRRRKKESSSGSGEWLTTFSDLMSLLLTFFILLFSMSSVDSEKFAHVSSSLQLALSGSGNAQDSIFEGAEGDMPILSGGQQAIYDQVNEYVLQQGLEEQVSITADEQGVYVDIKEAILFESGSAEIKDSGLTILQQLEGIINNIDNDIVIEGHTDDVPSGGDYPTNWELSTARAVSVVRYLTEVQGIDAKRISATGYGEYRPIVPNDSVTNRAANRRVNIFIVFEEESEG